MARFKPGILYGEAAWELLQEAKSRNAALPAINVIGSSSINACLEAAQAVNSPVIIQLSHGGSAFNAGKALDNSDHRASILGAVAAALHLHTLAESYGVPVLLHSDHAARKLLPWVDGMIEAGEAFYAANKRPLFSSHMLDLSEETLEENVATSRVYLERLRAMEMLLEIELGITGGEEDGVDNSGVDSQRLYTRPEEVAYAYEQLRAVSEHFTIAASFGNVHGVYAPGNVRLEPEILRQCQSFIQKKHGTGDKPVSFVFHGGSGSARDDIRAALSYGAVKFNIDTDTQWATLDGVRRYIDANHAYLETQVGNPEGADKPNKKFYDPRVWLREGEKSFVTRLKQAYDDLNATGLND